MSNAVAMQILEQLGNGTRAMLGAHQLLAVENGVQFGIKGSPVKVSKIRIELDAATDTYTVRFYRGRGVNIAQVSEHERVYVDSLHRLIESETKLYTRL